MRDTRDFLIGAIRRYRYLTVSANTFYLMRGSQAAIEPETVGITKLLPNGDVRLILDYDEPGREKRAEFAAACAEAVFEAQFMPETSDRQMARGYWGFIDQTGIFYTEKTFYERNPYRAIGPVLAAEDVDSNPITLSCNRIFRIPAMDHAALVGVANWSTGQYALMPNSVAIFLESWDPIKTWSENFEAVSAPLEQTVRDVLPQLIKSGFLARDSLARTSSAKIDA